MEDVYSSADQKHVSNSKPDEWKQISTRDPRFRRAAPPRSKDFIESLKGQQKYVQEAFLREQAGVGLKIKTPRIEHTTPLHAKENLNVNDLLKQKKIARNNIFPCLAFVRLTVGLHRLHLA